MAKPGATPLQRPPAGSEPAVAVTAVPLDGIGRSGDDALVAMFNRIRDELVSTLLYLLGNADDAQDAAQEAFLKCWRARHTLPEVQNLRAWIFRVGLNAAKDFQRSAWNRKSRPLPEDDLIGPVQDDPPAQALEEQETLDRLRAAITQLRQDPAWCGWLAWFWLRKSARKDQLPTVIGLGGFKGKPNDLGTVELGYSLVSAFQRQGFATEAVNSLAEWAFLDPRVSQIVGETLPELPASIKVLIKCGFEFIGNGSDIEVLRFQRKRSGP